MHADQSKQLKAAAYNQGLQRVAHTIQYLVGLNSFARPKQVSPEYAPSCIRVNIIRFHDEGRYGRASLITKQAMPIYRIF